MRKVLCHIRWTIRRDMPEVLAIENAVYEYPWGEDDFVRCLRQRNCIGLVAEHNEQVVGFVIYELHKSRLHMLNMAVHPAYQRKGVGTQLIQALLKKLHPDRRSRIMLEVRETNLAAQLFFRAVGGRAISVLREFYEETDEDAYLMQIRLPGTTPALEEAPA
jgi:ribosomal-protein-alanine N-acetyltransferase